LRQSVQRLHTQPLTALLALRQQFGDVVLLPRWPHAIYVLSHPEALHHVLRANASNYRKGVLLSAITALQGEGLLTSEGADWRAQRLWTQPAFRPAHLEYYGRVIQEEVQGLVHAWRPLADTDQPLDVVRWMHRLTFRVVGRALLALEAEALEPLGRQLQALAQQLGPGLSTSLTRTWRWPAWCPTARRWRWRRAITAYQALAQAVVKARQQRGASEAMDLLAVLLAAQDHTAAPALRAAQLRDAVITFIGAGVETTAQALSWTWYLLAQHSNVVHRIRAELDSVVGARAPTPADLPHLPYSRMVLDETLRLYPPAAVLPRQANAVDVINGYAIPRHAVVLMSPYVTHRHPDLWPEPERFCPERFHPARIAARPRCAYIPFGDGPRFCIGKPFALLEMHLALVTLAQAYTLTLVPGRPVVPRLATTLQPAAGLWMTVHTHR
jgi:cytochrome P450